jgi:hypothetical protein
MGMVPIQVCFSKAEHADVKILHGIKVMIESHQISGETMRVLEIKAKLPLGIGGSRVIPSLVRPIFGCRRLEKVCHPTHQCR